MNVLVLNCGSSSLKFRVIALDRALAGAAHRVTPGRALAGGLIERIGGPATLTFHAENRPPLRETAPVPDHDAAVARVIAWLHGTGTAEPTPIVTRLDAVSHRVVHGGAEFVQAVVVDDRVLAAIEAMEALAPLHNGPSLAGIRAARAALGPAVPMVAVFDTAFHATLPEHAAHYAIPHDLALRHGIRRYGFHGIAYRSALAGYCALTDAAPERATVVALHLGNGCSVAAIRNGQSVDTSMGLTPLEGLVMGTRSGDLDPAIVGHLSRVEGVSVDTVERWLNERSGLLGLSGRSRDMRDLLELEREDPGARLAVEVFCYRARKYVGAYLAALGGAEAVVFSGGIAEHSPEVRARVCAGLEWCGLTLDPTRNAAAVGVAGRISHDAARIHAFVVPADEETVIARDTVECLTRA